MQHNWVNFLHIYQPPWQEREMLMQLYENSYVYTLQTLDANPQIKITLNVTGSLTEHLVREGKIELIDWIRRLVDKGQIELVGSAMYHPIMPLIPETEMHRQIKLNEEYNQHYFKDQWRSAEAKHGGRGFFLPEVAYSEAAARAVEAAGFAWIVIDEVAFRDLEKLDWTNQYQLQNSKLKFFIRRQLPTEETYLHVSSFAEQYLLTVSDGEIYKRTIPSYDKGSQNWDKLAQLDRVNYLTAGEYFQQLAADQADIIETSPKNTSWRTTEAEEASGSVFHNWLTPGDPIHKELWDLVIDIGDLIKQYPQDEHMQYVREGYDKALSSCTWWWVDGRDLGYSPSEVVKGLNVIINTVRTFRRVTQLQRLEFEKRYSDLVYLIWERHWQDYK